MKYKFIEIKTFIIENLLKIKQVLILTTIIFLFSFSISSKAFASTNFTTDYKINYSVNESGTTHAVLSVILTNTTKQFYASSYQMQLGFDQIANIKASDEQGPINVTTSKAGDGYNVSLAFNKKSIGIGSKLPFKLEFDTESVAKNSGQIWEINIPGIANSSDFTSFTVDVKVPPVFGKPTIIKPERKDQNLTFNKDQLGKSGISIAFGEKQNFDFNLTYHLRNTNLYPVKTEIALPPDTNYQKVYIKNITPKPSNVIIDTDGNWLAQYNLSPAQKKDINVKGSVELSLNPQTVSISQDDKNEFTKPTRYWQSNNPKIKKLAKNLNSPEAIYSFVVTTLKYDSKKVSDSNGRAGALNSLDNPNSAVCREFTDLFIAIARAAGIPAREVNGYAYTENTKQRPLSLFQDVLHAWPEYYDYQKKTWVMVDPTWGSTTGGVDYFNVLDFDHIAFVIKGKDDNYPVPAGGYKFKEQKSIKDVSVVFSDAEVDKSQNVDLETSLPINQLAGVTINYDIKIKNNGSAKLAKMPLYIFSTGLTPEKQALEISEIPPYGSMSIKSNFDKTPILTNRLAPVRITYGEKTISQNIKISPFFMNILLIGGVIIGIFTVIILILAGKSRRLRLHR